MRRVRIAGLVAVLVMASMLGSPLDDGRLHGHRAQHAQHEFHHLVRLERAVREEPVKADRDPQPGGDVHA
jgi:hypothetical protein